MAARAIYGIMLKYSVTVAQVVMMSGNKVSDVTFTGIPILAKTGIYEGAADQEILISISSVARLHFAASSISHLCCVLLPCEAR